MADVTLWSDRPGWDSALERQAAVRLLDPTSAPSYHGAGSVNIFHIGNNRNWHEEFVAAAQHAPGVVVLHEICLQGLLTEMLRAEPDGVEIHISLMEHLYGFKGKEAAQRFWCGRSSEADLEQEFTVLPAFLQAGLATFTHTHFAQQVVSAWHRGPIGYARLPYAATPDSQQPVRVCNLPVRLVTFGFIAPNRRLISVLQALSTHPQRSNFELDIYGMLWEPGQIRDAIARFGLEDTVSLHGYVPETELNEALASAHLAINLRNPSLGEASASQLRIWDHALPSLVSAVGPYLEIPDNAVGFVRPDHEVEDVQHHLDSILANPDGFRQMGMNGRRLLKEAHTPESYVAALLGFVDRLAPPSVDTAPSKPRMSALSALTEHVLSSETKHLPARWDTRPDTFDSDMIRSVIELNEYELPDLLKPEDAVLDIGAHIGCFTWAAHARGAGAVHAYEAEPENARRAREHVGHLQGVSVDAKAVWRSDGSGPRPVYAPSADPRNTGGGGCFAAEGTPVPFVAFDDVVARVAESTAVRLVKLDVEGSEYPILYTSRLLSRVQEIIGEYHNWDEKPPGFDDLPDFTIDELAAFLRAQGFRMKAHADTEKFGHFWAAR
jgi:FkbM family methyltransferase